MNWLILILFEVFLTKSLFCIMVVDGTHGSVATKATNNELMNHSMNETEPQQRSVFQNNHEQKLLVGSNNGSNNPQHLHLRLQQVNRNATTTTTTTIMARRMLRYNTFLNTFIFSLTLIPLLFTLARALNTWPHYHGFYYARRLKRSSPTLSSSSYVMNSLNGGHNRLPLMSKDDTRRFLSLFEQTLSNRRILDDQCRKYYSCKVFQNAVRITDSNVPKLSDFEWSLLETFGIVVERYDLQMDLVRLVKMYYEIATNALKGISCKHQYPCIIQEKNKSHKTGTWSQHRS